VHAILEQVKEVSEDNDDIVLWWVKTYCEVNELLEQHKEFDDGLTITTMEVLNEMFTQGHDCFLPLNGHMNDTINGKNFVDYCRQLQQKKKGKAA
jgi:hypothetical protein